MENRTQGHILYQLFYDAAGGQTPSGIPMRPWEELDDVAQANWEAAAAGYADMLGGSGHEYIRVGDMAHYVSLEGYHLAAVVTRVNENDPNVVDLTAFGAASRDHGSLVTFVMEVKRQERDKLPGTWHFIELF